MILSPKHGLNPSLMVCWLCLKETGVALCGRILKGDDQEAPPRIADTEPCPTCREYMQQGIILISVDDEKTTDKKNPYRTGGWVVVKEEAVKRILIEGEFRDRVLESRCAFITDDVWDKIGLPREKAS